MQVLLFYVFDFYIFTPVSLAFGFTAIYKSNKHLKHYPSSYSKLLRLNAWFLEIFSVINFLFLMLTEEMGIMLLLPLFGISSIIQFIVGELEKKKEFRSFFSKEMKMLLFRHRDH